MKSLLSLFRGSLDKIRRFPNQHGMFGMPSLEYDYAVVPNVQPCQEDSRPQSLSEIFGHILNIIPRNRRSAEKRLTRKLSEPFINAAKPKKNIIICLVCGQPHEAETICGNCYAKVREETESMREAMSDEVYYYDQPRKEVAYLYQGENLENFPKYKGRYIVEIEKERPSWFPSEFLDTKKRNDSDSSS